MVSYVMESRKGRRSLVALLVALAIATVGLYLATSATATKPAKATVTRSLMVPSKTATPTGI